LKSKNTVCHEIFRQMNREKDGLPGYKILIRAHPAVVDMLQREEKLAIEEAASRFQRQIVLEPKKDYHLEQYDLTAG
jgi:ribonuclease G